jgi:hypothetical protein
MGNADRWNWKKAAVPGVWQKYGERYDIFEGSCWFAREFDLAETVTPQTTARIRFGGVNYLCDIYINEQLADSHEGGYTEFTVDITKHIKLCIPGMRWLGQMWQSRFFPGTVNLMRRAWKKSLAIMRRV